MWIDVLYIVEIFPKLIEPFFYTVSIVLASAGLSLLLCIPITFFRINRLPVVSRLCDVWLSFIRSMPGILELFVAYFVLPRVLKQVGINISDWAGTAFVLIALVFHYAPYLSEIFRPAYLSVEKGQHEAGAIVGMTGFQTLRRIILPQAIPVALPQLCSTLIDIVKDTSLLFTIGIVDLMGEAKLIITDNNGIGKMEAYIAVAVFYWVLTIAISKLFALWEKYYRKYKLSAAVKM